MTDTQVLTEYLLVLEYMNKNFPIQNWTMHQFRGYLPISFSHN